MSKAEEINRIIVLDAKDDHISIKNKLRDTSRDGDANTEPNLKDDILITANALTTMILKAEEEGIFKKGEGMTKTVELMGRCYVDTEIEVSYKKHDEFGRDM